MQQNPRRHACHTLRRHIPKRKTAGRFRRKPLWFQVSSSSRTRTETTFRSADFKSAAYAIPPRSRGPYSSRIRPLGKGFSSILSFNLPAGGRTNPN